MIKLLISSLIVISPILLASPGTPETDVKLTAAASPKSGQLVIVDRGVPYMTFDYMDWDVGWGKVTRQQSVAESKDAATFTYENTLPKSKAAFTVNGTWQQIAPERFRLSASLNPKTSAPLRMAQVSLAPGAAFQGTEATISHADGKNTSAPIPFPRGSLGKNITGITLVDSEKRKVVLTFDSPISVSADGEARLELVSDRMEAGKTYSLEMTLALPAPASFYPGASSLPPTTAGWYEFTGESPIPPNSEWSLASWLEAPAGMHGRILSKDDVLIYNGKPIKLWGINVSYAACAPEKELADRRADFYAALGVNAVRLHKYADGPGWAGIQSEESSASLDPAGLERMDYFVAALKKRGIYVKLSPVFIMKIGPGDFEAVPYAQEFGDLKGERIDPKHGSFYLSTEIQDLLIKQMTDLLKHRNPHTGLTYAEDPVVAYIELYNEDSALFGGINRVISQSPTLRARAGAYFSAWLKKKYGTEAAVKEAWGENALNNAGFLTNAKLPLDESWAEERIYPAGNPWFFDPANLGTSHKHLRQRLLDTMEFLYDLQNSVYDRYAAAVRATGYSGEIIASNWQAGRAMSHFYNLHSDARIGTIDRHNYFGGDESFPLDPSSMLAIPGGATLSTSLQQVADRPFMLSEWAHRHPSEQSVEGLPVIGAYGMGLQDWDASFAFQNTDDGTFPKAVNSRNWDFSVPFLSILPAVSRQVQRGDVLPSPIVHTRNVHVPSLASENVGFEEFVNQQFDIKTFDSDVFPAAALAAARGVVRFTDAFVPTEPFDLGKYQKDGDIISSTGQLRWHPGKTINDGFITINTPGTQAVVGFAKDQEIALTDVQIHPESPFAAIYVTAQSKAGTVAGDQGLLVSAVARARNEGTVIADDLFLFSRGELKGKKPIGPVMMEPVRVTLRLNRAGNPTIHILDHNGVKTGKTLPVSKDGVIQIDTGRDATPHYLIQY